MLLIEKYKPTFDSNKGVINPGIVGCKPQQVEFHNWLKDCSFAPEKVQPIVIIHGPNGVGKTSAIEALLSYCKVSFYNVDPMDMSSTKSIEYMNAVEFAFRYKKDKSKRYPNCVIIIEGMLGVEEVRIEKILDALHRCPCILMNHASDSSLNQQSERDNIDEFRKKLAGKKTYKKKSKDIYFPSIAEDDIVSRLSFINNEEKLGISDELLKNIAESSDGNLCAAINSLQFGVGFDRKLMKSASYLTPIDVAKNFLVSDYESWDTFHNEHLVDGKKVPYLIHEMIVTQAKGNFHITPQFAKVCDQFSLCDALHFEDNRFTNDFESLQSILPAREFHLLFRSPEQLVVKK